jgi:hypothetical protein
MAESPGTITPVFENAPSFVSKCKPAMRFLSSGPWQVKQLSDRIGRICRSKTTAGGAALAQFPAMEGERK